MASRAAQKGSNCLVNSADFWARWSRSYCRLVLRPKLLKANVRTRNPASFIAPAIAAVVLVVWMKKDVPLLLRRVLQGRDRVAGAVVERPKSVIRGRLVRPSVARNMRVS
jgi:hypothetical protein